MKKTQQYAKAIADSTTKIKLDPKDSAGYSARARAYKKTNQYAKALADYEQAVKLGPRNAFCHNSLAWFLVSCPDARLCNGPRAVQLATRATQLKPKAAYFDTLAAAYAATGNFKKAAEVQAKALDMLRREKGSEKRIADYNLRLQRYKSGKSFKK